MTLADHVRTLGRGPGRSRSLTEAEAQEAMRFMLSGAAPEAVGALLMLLRMKGETAEEIAGFARAAQRQSPELPKVDLDWPCYAAGRTRGQPWFLLAAKLLASSGRSIVLHGWNGPDPKVRQGLQALQIPVARDADAAARALAHGGIVYLPLEDLHPQLFALLNLREVLGLRSCINTVCRMLNPGRAAASVQGVFHPSYRLLQADAARLLGWRNLTVLKGGGGEFERHPGKPATAFGLRQGDAWQAVLPALSDDGRRLEDLSAVANDLVAMWEHGVGEEFGRDLALGTAQLALETLNGAGTDATQLWQDRYGAPVA